MNNQPPASVFVVGVFRSGTSLLYALLNQHPEIALLFEGNALDFPPALERRRLRHNWLERQEFFNQALSRHRLIFGGSLRGMEEVRQPSDLYRVFADGKGARYGGEKSPAYIHRLPRLARQCPGCAVIVIWRDPLEIYQSLLQARKSSPFFRRSGMLDRIIDLHEKLIRNVCQLRRTGVAVHEIDYSQLVADPGATCRGICDFLKIDFDPRMASLADADLTSVYLGSHHNHLRNRVITRQQQRAVIIPQAEHKLLEQFHRRWQRLRGKAVTTGVEPPAIEIARHKLAAKVLETYDTIVRVLFEFLPLTWLKTYRAAKKVWLKWKGETREQPSATPAQPSCHVSAICGSYLLLGLLVIIHWFNPHLVMLPLYFIPCAWLTLKLNRHWGLCAAATASFVGPLIQLMRDPDYASYPLMCWNTVMRFIMMALLIALTKRFKADFRDVRESAP